MGNFHYIFRIVRCGILRTISSEVGMVRTASIRRIGWLLHRQLNQRYFSHHRKCALCERAMYMLECRCFMLSSIALQDFGSTQIDDILLTFTLDSTLINKIKCLNHLFACLKI